MKLNSVSSQLVGLTVRKVHNYQAIFQDRNKWWPVSEDLLLQRLFEELN